MAARRWATGPIALVALALLWRILAVNATLEGVRPGMLGEAARSDDATFVSHDDGDALREWLRRDPAEVGALVLLAQGRERENRLAEAERGYRLAIALAPQDPTVLDAAAAYFLRHGPALEGFVLMGRLAERQGRDVAFPVFARLLASGGQPEVWRALLAGDPQWVGPFIVEACRRDLDARRLAPLLLERVASGHRNAAEIGCVVDRLRAQDRWADAYQLWLNTLPRERLNDVGFVFNGGFEQPPSGVGFDWIVAQAPERETGYVVDLLPALGAVGTRALRIEYNGKRQNGTPVAQFTALAPGRYRLSGQARSEGLKLGRGAVWTLRCVQRGRPERVLATSERFVGSSDWHRFEMPVQVPPDCAGQVLQLEPADAQYGPTFLGGRLWFDDLVMQRSP